MNKPITFITGNAKKLLEVQSFMPYVQGMEIDLPEIQSMDMKEIVTAKINAAFNHCDGPLMVDDTALYMDCFHSKDGSWGLPGPLVKWYLHTLGNRRMVEIASALGNARAHAKTIIAYAAHPSDIHFFVGSLDGHVVNPDYEIGFGWDGIFIPDGYNQTLATLSLQEKNKISMRGLALQELQKFLAQ